MRILVSCLVLALVGCAGNREAEPPSADAPDRPAVTPPERGAVTEGGPYLVRVEGVECPHTVTYGGSLEVRLYGTVGNDGCHHLHEVAVTWASPDTVVVEPYGVFRGGAICTQVIVPLDETVVVEPVPETDFVLVVRRANGEPLRFPVTVER